jgi:hypothetical protein
MDLIYANPSIFKPNISLTKEDEKEYNDLIDRLEKEKQAKIDQFYNNIKIRRIDKFI